MRVVLADDHPMIRDIFKLYITMAEPAAEVFTVPTLDDALKAAASNAPIDAVVLDLRMPGMEGLQGFQLMQKAVPGVPVILMSGVAGQKDVEAALALGARGFLPKVLSGRAIINALQLMIAGEIFVPYSTIKSYGTSMVDGVVLPTSVETKSSISGTTNLGSRAADPAFAGMTGREREVLPLLEIGLSNKEIAQQLGVKEETIKLYVRGICHKLGAKNRTQAAMHAHALRNRSKSG